MMEAISTVARVAGYAVIALCLSIVVFKVMIWNLSLPYSMIRAYRRGVQKGFSIFPLIEIVPLLMAIGLSFVLSGNGMLSPHRLAVLGVAAIVGSYCHLALVLLLYGVYRRCKGNRETGQGSGIDSSSSP